MKSRPLTISTVSAFAALFCSPIPASAQSILKTAGNYTVLASQAVTVAGTGFTITNGNVGLFPAATSNITGFPPGMVSGTTLMGTAAGVIITGGATQQAQADLQVAATGLAAMPLTANYSNVDMANLGPLPPGVYKWNAAASLTGALVLDAQGHNNASWVFQFGTGLTTAVNSSVTLINPGSNGGADDGIFWNAATGAIVIGDNNTILGNYIAYTSVSFTGSTQLLGNGGARFMALNGAVTFAGPGTTNALGVPGGGDWTGGLTLNGSSVVAAVAPVITSPAKAPGTVGSAFVTYLITAAGLPTSYTATGLPPGLTLNSVTGAIDGTPTAAGVSIVSLGATNSFGTGTATLSITVAAAGAAPIITSPPTAPGTVGSAFVTYPITATGLPTSYTATGLPPGLTLNGLTGAINGTPTASGVSTVALGATNGFGTGSATLSITVAAAGVVPIFTSPPTAPGTVGTVFVTYPIEATGLPTSYTATGLPPGLTLNPVTGAIDGTPTEAGTYFVSITATNSSGTSTTTVTMVIGGGAVISNPPSARLINISTRAQVGTGGNIMIPGFVIGGSGTETLLIRADGPGLAQFGVTGVLAQPRLSVSDSTGRLIASNTGWGTNSNPAQIVSNAASVGAFPLISGSADCSLIVSLRAGAYTVQVSGVNNTTGVALAEVYEVSSTGTRLINISTRAQVGTGSNIIIPGFVIAGSGAEQLLVRADGPGLTQFGVPGALAQPSLRVSDSAGKMVASNTGWGTISNPGQITSIGATVGAFALVQGSHDSAQIVNLSAGAYTMQVSGVNDSTGVALAEVYEVP